MEPALRMSPAQGRLLLVDDEENILSSHPARAPSQPTGRSRPRSTRSGASRVLERFTPEVVISDFRMPGMNGVEFLTRVKQRSPARPADHAAPGQADQQAIEEAINRSEIFRFIAKPWNDAQLLLTVQSAFEQYALQAENARL